jgi:hypothetical protein
MNEYQSNEKYYLTSNFYCSVFLFVKGLHLVDIDRSNPQRAQFVFLETPEREDLVKQFNYSERNSSDVLIDAREFEQAIKTLKDRLYQGRE